MTSIFLKHGRRGQIIMIMCITLVAVILFVSVIIYLTSTQHLLFNYNPSREMILNIDSDFHRMLTRVLANATSHYNKTAEMTEPRRFANLTFSYWVLSTQAAYAGKGLNIQTWWTDEIVQGAKTLRMLVGEQYCEEKYPERRLSERLFKLSWYRPNSISAIGAGISIDSATGIVGWRANHLVLLNLTITSIRKQDPHGNDPGILDFDVVVLREGEEPVNDLKASNFEIYLFDPTARAGYEYWWRRVELHPANITYNGGGNYTFTLILDKWFHNPSDNEMVNKFWSFYYRFILVRVQDNRGIIVESYSYSGIEYTIKEKAIEGFYPNDPAKTKETYVFELLPNGTMYWFNEALYFPDASPIPLPPVKQIRINATKYGPSDEAVEIPYQTEVWDDRYLWPKADEFLQWRKRLVNGSKIVFELNYPPGIDTQRVVLTWLEDCDAKPPEYRLKMFISQGLGKVDTGMYVFHLVVDPEEYGPTVGGHVDWCFSFRKKEGGSESWVDFFLLGYNATRPTDTGPCVLPNKMAGGDWMILPKPREEGGVLISEAPVRLVAYRRSNIVKTVPAPDSFNMVEPGEPPQPGRPSPGPVEVTDCLYHETVIYIPYNVPYFLITVNATWLKNVNMDKYRAYLGLIGMVGPPAGSDSDPNRVQWGSLMTSDGKMVNGSFCRDYTSMTEDYMDHRGRGWGLRTPETNDNFLVESGGDYGYWASLYRDGFGVALFASESLLSGMEYYSSRDRLWVWTNPLGSRRFMEYDAVGWDSRSSEGFTFVKDSTIRFKAAGFILEGGSADENTKYEDDDNWNDRSAWVSSDDDSAWPFGRVLNPSPPVPGQIEFVERNAFFWDDFANDPKPEWLFSGAWSWNAGGYMVATVDGGRSTAYCSNSIPPGTRVVYVLSRVRFSTSASGQHVGLLMRETDDRFYTLGYYRGSGNTRRLRIYRYAGTQQYSQSQSSVNLEGQWYTFCGYRNIGTVLNLGYMYLGAYSGATLRNSVERTDTEITVNTVGLFIRDETAGSGSLTAWFDDFIASSDKDPRYVEVTGLARGQFAYLLDNAGNVLASASADSEGIAKLDVTNNPIVRNGFIQVGVSSQGFDLILGGDVYRFISEGTVPPVKNAADESMMYHRMFREPHAPQVVEIIATPKPVS